MRTLALFSVTLLLAGCTKLAPSAHHAPDPAAARFSKLAEDYVAGYLAWRPQMGTLLGLHQYDGRAPDYSRASLTAELARLKRFERRLSALDSARLSPQERFDQRLLLSAVRREIFGFEDLQTYTLNPMVYAGTFDVNIYMKRDFAPLADRLRSVIAILKQAPELMADAHANLADALPRPQVETAIEVATGAADFLAKDLVEAFKGVTDPALQADFQAANQRAVEELRGFATWLHDQKLPKANDHYALGHDKYARMLLVGEMLDLAPEHLLDLGLRELAHQQAAFADAAHRIDPTQPPRAVFRAIQQDHPPAAELIADTTRDLEAIRQFVLDHHIVTLPSPVRAQVAETPQFMRATSFASMDTPGPFETKATEAYYYVTPVDPTWPPAQQGEWLTAFNYYTTDIVSIHEAYPGHYVQFLCLNASPATRLEKIFTSYAFVEGWAHYAEQMMVDEGFGADTPGAARAAKFRLAQADEALLRVCRLCVSIKMHCQGMTVEQATRFFQDNCYYEEKPAHDEAMRGTFDPEYLYYTVGKLELLKLRADYRQQVGGAFDLRAFHDEVLRHGAPPIRLLREVMLTDPARWKETL